MEPGVRAGVRHARGGVAHALVRVRVRVRVWARLRVRARATLGVMLAFTLRDPYSLTVAAIGGEPVAGSVPA